MFCICENHWNKKTCISVYLYSFTMYLFTNTLIQDKIQDQVVNNLQDFKKRSIGLIQTQIQGQMKISSSNWSKSNINQLKSRQVKKSTKVNFLCSGGLRLTTNTVFWLTAKVQKVNKSNFDFGRTAPKLGADCAQGYSRQNLHQPLTPRNPGRPFDTGGLRPIPGGLRPTRILAINSHAPLPLPVCLTLAKTLQNLCQNPRNPACKTPLKIIKSFIKITSSQASKYLQSTPKHHS